MEKWLFRAILATAALGLTAAVLGSTDDIKRYIKISRM